jgi:hypothetical protein
MEELVIVIRKTEEAIRFDMHIQGVCVLAEIKAELFPEEKQIALIDRLEWDSITRNRENDYIKLEYFDAKKIKQDVIRVIAIEGLTVGDIKPEV